MTRKKPISVQEEPKKNVSRKDQITEIIKKKSKEKFLSENQKKYYDLLINNQITICSGPAGVGKSYIAMKAALDLLSDPLTPYEKIIIVRPAVEAEEKLGSLPGNVEEKLDPYIFPSYYLMNKIIGKEAREKLKQIDVIEVFALAYMRGMNIDNSILIFEEAQNSTPNQMKLLLTRIGFNSKFFISGDLEQTDRYKDKRHSGLWDAIEKFKDLSDVGVFEFDNKDVVRNPLINTFNDLNEIYINLRDNHELLIVSDEISKSKPATLFFLSKFGCLVEKIKFYSNITMSSMWSEVDVLLTSNPSLLLECPKEKIVIKFETEYNKNIDSLYMIRSIKEFEKTLKQITEC